MYACLIFHQWQKAVQKFNKNYSDISLLLAAFFSFCAKQISGNTNIKTSQ
jgi:hypothetical protein